MTVVKNGTAMVILPVSISRMPLLKSCSALAATESSTCGRVRVTTRARVRGWGGYRINLCLPHLKVSKG
jgi:hypothetical protein